MSLKNLFIILALSSPCLAAESFHATEFVGKGGRLSPQMKISFEKNGYLIVRDFFKKEIIAQAVEEYKEIVRKFPQQNLGYHGFDTDVEATHNSDKYFFESADEIWPFYNSTAKDTLDSLPTDLSNEDDLFAYMQTINKVGHNLHGKNEFFKNLFLNDPILTCRDIKSHFSIKIFQTTIVSKTPVEDSQYNAHQDGTFIGQEGKVAAYWIPLTPALRENGCLWGIPGSHKFPINWWYRKEAKDSYKCGFVGQKPDWDLSQKVYLETDPGDLLVFSGTFVHGSDPSTIHPNSIQDLRLALTYHFGPTDNWDPLIWLKLSDKNCFPL